MPNYLIIPQIGEKIKCQLKKLRLKPEVDPIKFVQRKKNIKHRYYSNCLDSKGRKIGFYARIHNNEDAKSKMLKEMIFLKEIKKNKKLKLNKYIPRFIKGEINEDLEWFTREYAEGSPLGETHILKSKLSVSNIPFFIDVLTGIQEIAVSSLKNKIGPYLKEHGNYNKDYLSSLRNYRGFVKKKIISENQYQKISQLIYRNKKLINNQRKFIVHSDIHPGNIIVNSRQWLIDWELIRIDNPAYDISYIWMHFWEADPKFRRELIDRFTRETCCPRDFKMLFRLSIIYLWIGEIFCVMERTKIKRIEKRYQFLKRLLENVLRDFESVIKT